MNSEIIVQTIKSFTFIDVLVLIGGPLYFIITVKQFLKYRKERKEHDIKYKKLESSKCEGPHTWLSMDILGKETHVCKECYYCPDHECFVKGEFVRADIERKKFKLELEQYKENRIREIGAEIGLDESKTKDIYTKFVSIQKEFTLDYLEKALLRDKKENE
jgi:hypothetical protein